MRPPPAQGGREGRWPGSGIQILTRGGWQLQAYLADNDWTWPDSQAGATMAPAWAGGCADEDVEAEGRCRRWISDRIR